MNLSYWSNFRGLTADAYVARFIETSAVDRQRLVETAAALPAGVSTLLDVGCGFGHFLKVARDARGIGGIGVELAPEKVEYARRVLGVDARVASVDALPFPDRAFDAVCALEVVEHLPLGPYDRGREELARVARRWVLISVPWRERRRNVECPACGCTFNHNYHLRTFRDADFPRLIPGFALRSLRGMAETRVTPAWVDALRPWHRPPMPPFAVCPACGYHSAASVDPAAPDAAGAVPLRRFAIRLRGLLRDAVRRTTPCWYLALFERAELSAPAAGSDPGR